MSGRGVLQSAHPTVPNRRIAEAVGRGFFQQPTSQLQQNSDLLTSSNESITLYPLDDLTLEGVKLHLSSTESVFLAPISRRFGSIRVSQCCLSLFIDVFYRGYYDRQILKDYALGIQNRRGCTMAQYCRMSQMELADLLMFIMDSFGKFQLISIRSTLDYHNQDRTIVSDLCAAMVENGPINVRSFHLNRSTDSRVSINSLPELLGALSPSLRHLKLQLVRWQPDLVQAIGGCQQLHSLVLDLPPSDVSFAYAEYWPEMRGVVDVLGHLPRLNSFRSIQFERPIDAAANFSSLKPAKHSCSLHTLSWVLAVHRGNLKAGADWQFKTFLHRIANVTLTHVRQLDLPTEYLTTLDFIIASMTDPLSHCSATNATAQVVISTSTGQGKLVKTPVLLDWMRMASRYRVIITLKSNHRSPTLEKIADIVRAVADNNADSNNAAIHGLDLPIQHQPGAQTFSFFGGGSELRLRSID